MINNLKKTFKKENKQRNIVVGIVSLIVVILSTLIIREFTPINPNAIEREICSSTDSVTVSGGDWVTRVGGSVSSSHCARVRYKIPENSGMVLTSFYMKSVIVLPDDFYSKMYAGFRIMNTDNFKTTLNGASVGAKNANEARVGLWIYNSDKKLHFRIQHEGYSDDIELYVSPTSLSVGQHTLEIWGDVSKVAPWGLRIDEVMIATGNRKLCNPSNLQSECVITRVGAGIDGAADADSTFFELRVKSLSVSDGLGEIDFSTETPSVTPIFTDTKTPTSVSTPTFTLIVPTKTIEPTPTFIATPSSTFTVTPECFKVSGGTICFYID